MAVERITEGKNHIKVKFLGYSPATARLISSDSTFLISQWIGAGRRARVFKTGRGSGLWKWYMNCNQLTCSTTAWALTRIFIHLNSPSLLSGCRLMDDASRARRAIL